MSLEKQFERYSGEELDQFMDRLEYLQLEQTEIDLIKKYAPYIEPHLNRIVSDFLDYLMGMDDVRKKLQDSDPQRLTSQLEVYLKALFSGRYDAQYVKDRLRVGAVHQREGVQSRWYLTAYRKLLFDLLPQVQSIMKGQQEAFDQQEINALFDALSKVVFFDISLAIDTYFLNDKLEILRTQKTDELALDILKEEPATNESYSTIINKIAKRLASALQVKFVRVVRLAGPKKVYGSTVSLIRDGKSSSKTTYPLANTACAALSELGEVIYPNSAFRLFNQDKFLIDNQIECYAGVTLKDTKGEPFALLSIMHDQPYQDLSRLKKLLFVTSSRIARNLEREDRDQHINTLLAELKHQATYDELTKLPNRNLFYDRFRSAINIARRKENKVALMYLDLDNFKTINDTDGHETGDKLLIEVAYRLHSALRSEDTVARIGGDEFLIVLTNVNKLEDILTVRDNLNSVFESSFRIENRSYHTSASIGISVFPEDGEDVETLIKNADIAMYKAKEDGKKNACFFSREMSESTLEKAKLERSIRSGIEQNEFQLFYQPIVDAKTQTVHTMEALVRWKREDGSMVPPDQFIPVAEANGTIVELGYKLLEQALGHMVDFKSKDLELPTVAINISPIQLTDPEFVNKVKELIYSFDVPTKNLVFEITENIFIRDVGSAYSVLDRLKAIGIHISLDDFGTGYSSLSYLKKFAFDSVKIDKSFIQGLKQAGGEANLVNAIVSMGHSLGMPVIAEGVESVDQLNFLQKLGCDFAQGYYFAKPQPYLLPYGEMPHSPMQPNSESSTKH